MSSKNILPVLIIGLLGLMGCDEPLTDESASEVLQSCCQAAMGRIANVNDVESANFRKRCETCRRGNSKSQCEIASTKVQSAVKAVYNDDWPVECTTMREGLASRGIKIPQIR